MQWYELRLEQETFLFFISGEAGEREWCKLAYWELATRVGRLFSVELPEVNVFTSLPHGDGLCLATLTEHTFPPPNDSVRRTRAKIGLGKYRQLRCCSE